MFYRMTQKKIVAGGCTQKKKNKSVFRKNGRRKKKRSRLYPVLSHIMANKEGAKGQSEGISSSFILRLPWLGNTENRTMTDRIAQSPGFTQKVSILGRIPRQYRTVGSASWISVVQELIYLLFFFFPKTVLTTIISVIPLVLSQNSFFKNKIRPILVKQYYKLILLMRPLENSCLTEYFVKKRAPAGIFGRKALVRQKYPLKKDQLFFFFLSCPRLSRWLLRVPIAAKSVESSTDQVWIYQSSKWLSGTPPTIVSPTLAFFLFIIATVAADAHPLTLNPGQPSFTFELIEAARPPIAHQSWKLLATVDSTDYVFHGVASSTVLDVTITPQCDSFGDFVRLSFSLMNEGDVIRTVRLGLNSAISGEMRSSLFVDGIFTGVSFHQPDENATLFALARDFSTVWVGPSAGLVSNQWHYMVGDGGDTDSVALSWQGISLYPGQTIFRVVYFARNQSTLRAQARRDESPSVNEV
jgi:hypothetical protein